MTLQDFIKHTIEEIEFSEDEVDVTFNVGIDVGLGKIIVDKYSSNRVKFTLKVKKESSNAKAD